MLADKLKNIQQRIDRACTDHHRQLNDVCLLAVSKRKSAALIRQAYNLGQHDFGENYLQEVLDKQSSLDDLPIKWHFIGQIQSNKTGPIAENFSWVHSVDRLKIAQRLSQQRPQHLPPLNICLQINIDNEDSKAGFDITTAQTEAAAISTLPNIVLRGLMAIPATQQAFTEQRHAFAKLKCCFNEINASLGNNKMDTLSMGMSQDLEAAIAEGATIIRIGTALFGSRD